MSSVVVKSIDFEAIRKQTAEFARRLLETRPEVEEVVVFGSFPRGTYAPGSDIDVLLILSGSGRRFRDRSPDYVPESFPVGMDVFAYTRRELERPSTQGFLAEALRGESWRFTREADET